MNADLLNVLKQIIAEQGDVILTNPKRVSAFLADLAQNIPKPQKTTLIKCLEHGFVQILKNANEQELSNVKQKLAQRLKDEEGLDLELCGKTLGLLIAVLFGEQGKKKNVCQNCGKELQEGWKICPWCATATNSSDIILPTTEGFITDPRDGKKYKIVKIGSQVWMAENLNYEAEGSKCYDNNPKNGEKYGKLYDWKTAMKVCPKGWHLPSNEEWNTLVNFVGGEEGKKLKAKEFRGTDDFGFAALPGGSGYSDGSFSGAGDIGYWWSASESSVYDAYYQRMFFCSESAIWYNGSKTLLFSVRCVQD